MDGWSRDWAVGWHSVKSTGSWWEVQVHVPPTPRRTHTLTMALKCEIRRLNRTVLALPTAMLWDSKLCVVLPESSLPYKDSRSNCLIPSFIPNTSSTSPSPVLSSRSHFSSPMLKKAPQDPQSRSWTDENQDPTLTWVLLPFPGSHHPLLTVPGHHHCLHLTCLSLSQTNVPTYRPSTQEAKNLCK